MRVALGIEYDGTHFAGWARQAGARTVAEVLERALSAVAAHPVATVCAGRTDAGVHATGQVVHFDSEAMRPERAWNLGVNTHPSRGRFRALGVRAGGGLPRALLRPPSLLPATSSTTTRRVRRCSPPGPRASIAGSMSPQCAVLRGSWWESTISAPTRASDCQARNPVRTVHHLEVERHGDFVVIDVCANAFLKRMVRNLAGVLQAVGRRRSAGRVGGSGARFPLPGLRRSDRSAPGPLPDPGGVRGALPVAFGSPLETPLVVSPAPQAAVRSRHANTSQDMRGHPPRRRPRWRRTWAPMPWVSTSGLRVRAA